MNVQRSIYSLLLITSVAKRKKKRNERMTSNYSLGKSAPHPKYNFTFLYSLTNFLLISIYTVQYSVQCTVYSLYSVLCTVYSLYSVLCTVYSLYSVQCTVYSLYSVLCTVYSL
jgi:hypothetical protein